MLDTTRIQRVPLRIRMLLEAFAVVATAISCFLAIPMIRFAILQGLNYLPLPFTEPLIVHLQIATVVGAISLIIRLFVSAPRGILYGFLIPFLATLVWTFDKQNLFINLDLWKLFEKGWFTTALLSGLIGLCLHIGVHLVMKIKTKRS